MTNNSEQKPSQFGFINNLLNRGELGTVHVGIDNKAIIKLCAGLVLAGGFIVLFWAMAKKMTK